MKSITFPGPIAQPQDYHHFVDTRTWFGIPNAADTLSNLALLAVGAIGIALLWRRRGENAELLAWLVFFVCVALSGLASAYYHLAPNDPRLFWDRLPIGTALTALVAALVAERIGERAGVRLLWPLVALGGASVLYWPASAALGAEDLRPYVAVQFGSVLAVAVLCVLPSQYTGRLWPLGAVILYAFAKLFELYDGWIYAHGGWVSGHTLKHIAAAAAGALLLAWLMRRERR
ncbi:MAG: hypothetical protein A3H32_04250 [Betaproteobacteria bacterium RIFCSPLOWO2_02_FULL_63_19]|nr:MAG: hypothetical protein A3H32_04250 [Betaproteobacteria bacterium RIFCSPLOWO2_02_FULL_63_19]